MKKTVSVLFIGNSYTYYNAMPSEIFKPLAEADGIEINVESITKGGWTLEKSADPTDEIGALVASALSKENKGKYDFVVLQEQSLRPARDDGRELFFNAVRKLASMIGEIGATPILYSTWGRKSGNEKLSEFGWTNEEMTERLASSYGEMASELNIPVAHVGLAFSELYPEYDPRLELYHKDKSHPSYLGSFLAALTIYAKIFDRDVRENSFVGNLSERESNLLRAAAHKTVFNV